MNIDRAPDDVTAFEAIRLLHGQPSVSQRELARALGVSVGKAHHCLRALIAKGLVKVRNYRNSRNKTAYLYILTPKGVAEKSRLARRFLEVRMAEYERLASEIERLRGETSAATEPVTPRGNT